MDDNFYTKWLEKNKESFLVKAVVELFFSGLGIISILVCFMPLLLIPGLRYGGLVNLISEQDYPPHLNLICVVVFFLILFAAFLATALLTSWVFRKLYTANLKSGRGSLHHMKWAERKIRENSEKLRLAEATEVFVGKECEGGDLPLAFLPVLLMSGLLIIAGEAALGATGEAFLIGLGRIVFYITIVSLCYLIKMRVTYFLAGCILPIVTAITYLINGKTFPGSFWWVLISFIPLCLMVKALVSSWRRQRRSVFIIPEDNCLRIVSDDNSDSSSKEIPYSCNYTVVTTYHGYYLEFKDGVDLVLSIALNTWAEVRELLMLAKFSALSTDEKAILTEDQVKNVSCYPFWKCEKKPLVISLFPILCLSITLMLYGGIIGFYIVPHLAAWSSVNHEKLYSQCQKVSTYFPLGCSADGLGITSALELGQYESIQHFSKKAAFLSRGLGEVGKVLKSFADGDGQLLCEKAIAAKKKVFSLVVPDGVEPSAYREFEYGRQLFDVLNGMDGEKKKSLMRLSTHLHYPVVSQYKRAWELSGKTYIPAAVEYMKVTAGISPYNGWDYNDDFQIVLKNHAIAKETMDELISAYSDFSDKALQARILVRHHKFKDAAKLLAGSNKLEDKLLLLSVRRFTFRDLVNSEFDTGAATLLAWAKEDAMRSEEEQEQRWAKQETRMAEEKEKMLRDLRVLLAENPEKESELNILKALILLDFGRKEEAREILELEMKKEKPSARLARAVNLFAVLLHSGGAENSSPLLVNEEHLEWEGAMLDNKYRTILNELLVIAEDGENPNAFMYIRWPEFVLPLDLSVLRCLKQYDRYQRVISSDPGFLERYNSYMSDNGLERTDVDEFVIRNMKDIFYLYDLRIGQHSKVGQMLRRAINNDLFYRCAYPSR